MKQVYIVIQGTVAAFIAWLSAKMGILLPVMGVLMGMMVMDYITGMLASKREALDHPDDPTYGWCSRRGAEGIIKKVGYLCVIAVAMVVDYLILRVVPMFITTLSQTRMKSRFLAADEYISPKKSNSVGASWLKPSRKIAHLRLSSPPYIMEAQRRQAR